MKKINSDYVGEFFLQYLWLKKGELCFFEENTKFLDRVGVPDYRRFYVSAFSPTVIALIDREDMERIRKDPLFLDMSEYDTDNPKKNEDDLILTQIGADSISGSNSPLFNMGEGFSGEGVKVGVISAENLIFSSMAKSLEGLMEGGRIVVLPSLFPPKTDRHPTVVVSEIVGRKIEVDNTNYFGVVRDATLYFASTKSAKGLYDAIEKMLSLGVKVINYSAGVNPDGVYGNLDRQIDSLIRENDFLFVTVSGNTGTLTSPGKAKNAISVGNLVTKSSMTKVAQLPWETKCVEFQSCSGFNQSPLRLHKPDLVAPGEYIPFVDENGEVDFQNFGTSFASPLVAGIAASLYQATRGEYSYLTIKALILMSANGEVISSANNPYVEGNSYIRERSGYGLLQGDEALKILETATIYEGRLDGERSYSLTNEMGDTLIIMFVFELPDGESDAPLVVLDGENFSPNAQNTLLIKKRSTTSNSSLSVVSNSGMRFSLVVYKVNR
ncbi:MAG: hypothetical protein E7582_06945 [Ruminococcaceae bacterium]|nr:hypothetical protein [Oscillospiraceae bacterium]